LFQLQRNDDDNDADPVEGLEPGVSASFSYDVAIPMSDPNLGTVTISEPADVAGVWMPTITSTLNAAEENAYTRGSCSQLVGTPGEEVCAYIDDNCFGSRVSLIEPIVDVEFELVNDGSADPTLGCSSLVGFTPGRIAVLRRGVCEFGVKAYNAETAGAVAVFMVNDGRCGEFPPSDQCALGMGIGDIGALVNIPVIQVAAADGEPVISAVAAGETVIGSFGGAGHFRAEADVFVSSVASDVDPNPDNDASRIAVPANLLDCPYDIQPPSLHHSSVGGFGSVQVTTAADCSSLASTTASWVSIAPGGPIQGPGQVDYEVAPNTGVGRAAAIVIGGGAHYVTQESGNGCTAIISPTGGSFPFGGGDGEISVSTPSGCGWTVSPTAPWITVTSASNGTGNATVTYAVSPNPAPHRAGAILVAGRVHTIDQDGWQDSVFIDGFESGDTSAWSSASP
jgi:hypothetical protein